MNIEEEKQRITGVLGMLDGLTPDEMMKMLRCSIEAVAMICEQNHVPVHDYKPNVDQRFTLCRRCEFNEKDGDTFICTRFMELIDGELYAYETAPDDGCSTGIPRKHYRRKP